MMEDEVLKRRLLRAMGVGPAALTLSLTACEAPPLDVMQPAADPPVEASGIPPIDAAHEASYEAPEEAPLPTPWVEVLNTPNAGHASLFQVRGALPFAAVSLHARSGGPLDDEAEPVATGFTDARGEAILYGFTPASMADFDALAYDVVHTERPEVLAALRVYTLSGLVPFRPDLTEIHPGVDPEILEPGDRRLVCVPALEYVDGICTAVADFHAWEAVEVVSYALDDALPPELSALACQEELIYPDSCCYYVEFWDTVNGSAADACQPPDQGGGGGGGGGGWGWCEGRPYTVDGVRAQAEVRRGLGWAVSAPSVPFGVPAAIRARAARAWLEVARAEHSSVASFSRFNLQLMQLGAPADLVARSTAAIADEIRHARDAFGMASELAGVSYTAGTLDVASAGEASDVQAALLEAIREGCINETVSATFVREAANRAADPEVAEMLSRVAEDETRHAELSWAFARWVLEQHPELRPEVAKVFASFELGPAPARDPDRDTLGALGVITDDLQHELAVEILERVVRPCAVALLSVT